MSVVARLGFCLLALCFVGCSGHKSQCIDGAAVSCACLGGGTGVQLCNDGAFDECICSTPTADAGTDASMQDASAPSQCALSGGSGCNKIDFLFVVDNSLSMTGNQANLATNFDAIFQMIRTRLDGVSDYHLMFVDSDTYGYEGYECEPECDSHPDHTQPLPGRPDTNCPGYYCGSLTQRSECDTVLGGAVVHPIGGDASNRDCDFPAGRRWLSSSDDRLIERATCAVRVGASGNGEELVLTAATNAVSPSTDAAMCNGGFLRDDALLVVVLVSDAGYSSPEQARGFEGFRRKLLAAKCDRASNVVVIGLIADGSLTPPDAGPSGCWSNLNGVASTYAAFIDSFGAQGFRAHVCEPSYADVFSRALDTIVMGCEETVW